MNPNFAHMQRKINRLKMSTLQKVLMRKIDIKLIDIFMNTSHLLVVIIYF